MNNPTKHQGRQTPFRQLDQQLKQPSPAEANVAQMINWLSNIAKGVELLNMNLKEYRLQQTVQAKNLSEYIERADAERRATQGTLEMILAHLTTPGAVIKGAGGVNTEALAISITDTIMRQLPTLIEAQTPRQEMQAHTTHTNLFIDTPQDLKITEFKESRRGALAESVRRIVQPGREYTVGEVFEAVKAEMPQTEIKRQSINNALYWAMLSGYLERRGHGKYAVKDGGGFIEV